MSRELFPAMQEQSEASYRLEQLAIEAARQHGFNFPRPIMGRQLSSPVMHWELVASEDESKEVCVLLDINGDLLNVEWRWVKPPDGRPWWKKLLDL